KQNWREDLTNRDTKRMRARIRKKLLPLLEKHFQPAIVEHLATLADLAREDEVFFGAAVEERMATVVRKHAGECRISIAELLATASKKEFNAEGTESTEDAEKRDRTNALSKRLMRRIVKEVKPRGGQLGAGHVEAVLELARSGRSGSSLPLPGGVEVRREHDALVFGARSSSSDGAGTKAAREFEHSIDLAGGPQEVRVPELGCVFRLRVIDWPPQRGETNTNGAVLDRDRLQFPLVLRNWRPGDRLQPVGRRNPHKLKRLLNEKRISRWKRDGWPVLTSGGILAWARGFPVGAEFAVNERTRAGMLISEEALTEAAEEGPA
ncbi:MAG: tRNA lysidine(34) synthetase TilS, partial [Candidatus Acidiferrum sp.]